VRFCCYYFVHIINFFFQRWQRRFFILYDDGELTYSVDENVRGYLFIVIVNVYVAESFKVEVSVKQVKLRL